MLGKGKKNTKTQETVSNRINLRITDGETLNLLGDLYSAPCFSSNTEVLNLALSYGVRELYAQSFDKHNKKAKITEKSLPNGENVSAVDIFSALKGLKIQSDHTAVVLAMLEKLLAVLYNCELLRANGDNITPEQFASNALLQLPENMEEIKDAILETEYAKRRKGGKGNA